MNKSKFFKGKTFLAGIAASALLASITALPVGAAVVGTEDTEAEVSFLAGRLTLESVPNLVFEETTIAGGDMVIDAETIDENIQVSDLRGSGTGWYLTADLGAFEDTAAEQVLQGAYITVNGATVSPESTNNQSGAPTSEDPIVMTSEGGAVRILTAEDDEGEGVWNSVWPVATTTLTVLDGTAREGEAVATIDWTLNDAA